MEDGLDPWRARALAGALGLHLVSPPDDSKFLLDVRDLADRRLAGPITKHPDLKDMAEHCVREFDDAPLFGGKPDTSYLSAAD